MKRNRNQKTLTCATVGPGKSSHTVTEPHRSACVVCTTIEARHDVTNARLAVHARVLVRAEACVRIVRIQARAAVLTRHTSAIVDGVNVWNIYILLSRSARQTPDSEPTFRLSSSGLKKRHANVDCISFV